MFRSFTNSRKGFTLIELLIVLVIIAVLATIGLVSYQNAIRNAKNSKAISDMKAIQAALEQAYTKNGGFYTTTSTGTTCDTSSYESAFTEPSGIDYTGPICTSSSYCACAQLTTGATLGNSAAGATSATCPALSGSGNFYCVKQRQ